MYFKVKLGYHDKIWAPGFICKAPVKKLRKWFKVTLENLEFGASMIFIVSKSHLSGYCFYLVVVKKFDVTGKLLQIIPI